MTPERVLFQADGVADGTGFAAFPGAVLVEWPDATGGGQRLPRTLAAGDAAVVGGAPHASTARRVDMAGRMLLPALANAHTHLDLTHLGPQLFDEDRGFAGWASMIRDGRQSSDEGIAESVREGVRLSLRGGVVAVGDIAGALQAAAVRALWDSPLMGVSFLEFFGVGERQSQAGDRLETLVRALLREQVAVAGRVRLGLQPHAPYSVGRELFTRSMLLAEELGLAVSTHLAETAEEHEFVAHGRGGLVEMLREIGAWDDHAARGVGAGASPTEHLAEALAIKACIVAHVNDCSDADLETLRRTRATVAYCPRASEYFGHEGSFGPHRYRDMLGAGVPVALGTDSIVNIPKAESGRLSVFDEMRRLFQRDGTSATTLLAMATLNGAAALGLDPKKFALHGGGVGEIAGLIAVDVHGAFKNGSALECCLNSPPSAIEVLVGGERLPL